MNYIHVIADSIDQFDAWVKKHGIAKDLVRPVLSEDNLRDQPISGFLLRLPGDFDREISDQIADRLVNEGRLTEIFE